MAATKVTHVTTKSYTGKDRRRIMAAASLGWGLEFFDLQLVSLLATPIADTFGVSKGQIGALFTAQLVATAFGGIIFGRLADVYGRKRVLTWTIWVFGLSTVLSAFAPTFWVFLLLRIVTGFGTGGEWAVGFSLLNEAWTPKRRGLAGGAVQSSLWFGYAAAILVTSTVTDEHWRWAFVIGGLPVLAAIWVRRSCPESKQWLAMRAGVESGKVSAQQNGLRMLARPEWLRIVVIATLVVMGGQYSYYVYSSWMPTYLKEDLGVSRDDANTILYISAAIALVSYLASGGLSDKIGRRSSLILFAVVQLVGFGLFTMFNINESSISLIVFSYFVISFGLGYFGIFGAWLGELFPTAIRASGSSVSYSIGRGIASTGPLIVGILAAKHGLAGGISTGAIAVVLMILFSFFLKDQKGREITAEH
ncbi:MFS transporter [Rhodococcus fascians]|nr:MFS transporter [Rhodococcus fascians]MBY4432681.1 MFS transporter [Rhodococcus fascians]